MKSLSNRHWFIHRRSSRSESSHASLSLALFVALLLLMPYGALAQTPASADQVNDGAPPAVLGDANHSILIVEAKLGGPVMYLNGYGTYIPPSTPPASDPACRITGDDGGAVGFFTQCLPTNNSNTTYMVVLTAPDPPPAQEWRHELTCTYGQAFGGGGLAEDDVLQTLGGNDNGSFTGWCAAGGLGGGLGSISAKVSDVPFKTPKSGGIVKIGLEVSVGPLTLPTWGCLASVSNGNQNKEEWLYRGCSSSGFFNAFAFGNAIALNF